MIDSSVNDVASVDSNILRDAMQPLREHLAFIVVFVLSAMLSALALTYIYSERYRAEATIFFKPAETTKLTQHTTEALGAPFPSNTQFIAVDKTISQLLDSDALLRQVVVRPESPGSRTSGYVRSLVCSRLRTGQKCSGRLLRLRMGYPQMGPNHQ